MKHNFDYLRPSSKTTKIRHKAEYIHAGSGKSGQRRIYLNTKYDKFEEAKIEELRAATVTNGIHLSSKCIPSRWMPSDLLRFLYASGFDIHGDSGALSRIESHLEFLVNREFHELSPEGEKLLENGIIYQYGKDDKNRPIIIISGGKINLKKVSVVSFLNAMVTLLEAVKKYMFVPAIIENWVFILDCTDVSISDFAKVLKKGIDVLSLNYPEYLENLYLYNPPSSLLASWKSINTLIAPNTVSKIVFVTPDDAPEAFKGVASDQLEQKFGGILPDLTNRFWPPQKTFGFSDGSDPEELETLNSGFKSIDFEQQGGSFSTMKNSTASQKSSSKLKVENSISSYSIFDQQRSSLNPNVPEKKSSKNERQSQPVLTNKRYSKSPHKNEILKHLEEEDTTRNSWSKKQARESFGETTLSRVKKAAQDTPVERDDSYTALLPETTKSNSSSRIIVTGKVFKEDTVFKQNRESNPSSQALSIKSNTAAATGSTSEHKYSKPVSDTPEYEFDDDDETDVKAKKESQKLIRDNSQQDESWYRELARQQAAKGNNIKAEDKGWFCGYCTIRKNQSNNQTSKKKK